MWFYVEKSISDYLTKSDPIKPFGVSRNIGTSSIIVYTINKTKLMIS